MSEHNKPLPEPTPWSRPFWEGTKRHELLIQQCQDCSRLIMYPRKYCPSCLSAHLGWVKASGRGTLYSFTVVENNPPSAFADGVPFVVAVVRLVEGVQMLSNIVGGDPSALQCDQEVEVVFDRVTADVTLPRFRVVGRE